MRARGLNRAMPFALALVLAHAGTSAAEEAAPAKTVAAASDVEEIYVLRSVRETRATPPSEACATSRSKLQNPAWEDNYTFRAVATDASTSRIVDTDAAKAGSIRACFGRTADAGVLELYGDLDVRGITGKAFGTCRTTKTNFPEQGVNLFACAFELFDLSGGYIGGQLTTNSLSSGELFGTTSKPEGYTQVSIATIRLWKKRG